jgi:aldose 1-epimerase
VGNLDLVVIRSEDGRIVADIDPVRGGRIARLTIDGRSLMIGIDHPDAHEPFGWGCYPMVPYCGRVRDARFSFDGREHALAKSAGPHSIHGTTFDRTWSVIHADSSSVEMSTDLGPGWPFRGHVAHGVRLDETGVSMTLIVTADEEMPAMVGWHPWFRKPERSPTGLTTMLRRDAAGITTTELVNRPTGPVDDCFVGRFDGGLDEPDELLTITIDSVPLALSSDCSHWVLYDEPTHATCVEPQSGPPNQISDDPVILGPGESMSRWFNIEVLPS